MNPQGFCNSCADFIELRQGAIFPSTPMMKTVRNDLYKISLETLKAARYKYHNRFRFLFANRAGRDLIIDCSRTFYLQNRQR